MALLNRALNLPIRQEEVDFVMPDVDDDRRLGIDPFLFYRSNRPDFQEAHQSLLNYFRYVLQFVAQGDLTQAQHLLICPEPREIGLGYSKRGTAGSGIGPELAWEIVRIFNNSPALLTRGLRHIEELQLVAPGIGPDRISDMTANVLKQSLVRYTQEQCEAWNISLAKDVPLEHYFDFTCMDWRDGYFNLPLNPKTHRPMLLVPRRVLRILPWINYEDYLSEYRARILRPVSRHSSLRLKPRTINTKVSQNEAPTLKPQVCQVTSQNTTALDSYIEKKEKEAAHAEPTELLALQDSNLLSDRAALLVQELRSVKPGKEDAYRYQDIVHRMLTFCFHPHLADGKPQERTFSGTLIRDLVFTNEGTRNFWRHLLHTYNNFLVLFELKNKAAVDGSDIDQVATYLGDTMGRFGILVSRKNEENASFKRRKAVFNKEFPRKVILHLTDKDLIELVNHRGMLKDTTELIQGTYRRFISSIE